MKKFKKHISWKWLIGLVALALLLLVGIYFPSRGQVASGNPAGESLPNDQKMIQDMQSALNNDQLSAQDRANLEKKLQLSEQLAAQRSGNTTSRGPKTGAGTMVPIPSASNGQVAAMSITQDEIINGSEGLIHAWEAQIQNLWQGERSGTVYQVLAGAQPDDPSQGLVIVITGQSGALKRSQNTYLAPEKNGALHVIGAQGSILILQDANGGTLSFDLMSLAFQK